MAGRELGIAPHGVQALAFEHLGRQTGLADAERSDDAHDALLAQMASELNLELRALGPFEAPAEDLAVAPRRRLRVGSADRQNRQDSSGRQRERAGRARLVGALEAVQRVRRGVHGVGRQFRRTAHDQGGDLVLDQLGAAVGPHPGRQQERVRLAARCAGIDPRREHELAERQRAIEGAWPTGRRQDGGEARREQVGEGLARGLGRESGQQLVAAPEAQQGDRLDESERARTIAHVACRSAPRGPADGPF